MAIQLYKPFVINELVNLKIAGSAKVAEKMIERFDPQIWDVLEELMDNHPVFLNRAPTLHRLGIQAFKPKLVEVELSVCIHWYVLRLTRTSMVTRWPCIFLCQRRPELKQKF